MPLRLEGRRRTAEGGGEGRGDVRKTKEVQKERTGLSLCFVGEESKGGKSREE